MAMHKDNNIFARCLARELCGAFKRSAPFNIATAVDVDMDTDIPQTICANMIARNSLHAVVTGIGGSSSAQQDPRNLPFWRLIGDV